MFAIERRLAIARLVNENGSVRISELSQLFGVSAETLRKDLLALEEEKVLERTHGGAVKAAIVNISCHPTVLSPKNLLISGDLLGFISYNPEVIEADRKGLSPYDCSPSALEEIRIIKAKLDEK